MPETASFWPAAFSGLALGAVLAFATWLASLRLADASVIDRVWPMLIAGPTLVYAWRLAPIGPRGMAMTTLTVLWALRLSTFITLRNRGKPEDRRYQEIRARNQPNFGVKSLYLVFGLQALLGWVVSAPALVGIAAPRTFGWLDFAGLLLCAFGIVFEAIADAQMARFRTEPSHAGQVMDRGLWRYSRHPNYFGEACIWWGLAAMALSGAGLAGAWSLVSPLLMTVLLLKVSGVSLLEKDIVDRRPAYRDYIARTNAFFPGAPR